VHAGGHFWIGGDPGGDLYASPGDPYFFLHHAQIDRTWWIWQNQDLKNRQNAIAGTNTIFNFPPSANTTLDDLIDLGVNAPALRIGNVMSTISDQFCYTYA
jgi:tyrosinase